MSSTVPEDIQGKNSKNKKSESIVISTIKKVSEFVKHALDKDSSISLPERSM